MWRLAQHAEILLQSLIGCYLVTIFGLNLGRLTSRAMCLFYQAATEELLYLLRDIFCLFSHEQIDLTWSNSVVVFDYFKPPEPPTFDSKANTISAEVGRLWIPAF